MSMTPSRELFMDTRIAFDSWRVCVWFPPNRPHNLAADYEGRLAGWFPLYPLQEGDQSRKPPIQTTCNLPDLCWG